MWMCSINWSLNHKISPNSSWQGRVAWSEHFKKRTERFGGRTVDQPKRRWFRRGRQKKSSLHRTHLILSELLQQINKYDIYPDLFRTTKQRSIKGDTSQELNRSDIQSDNDTSFQPSDISTPVSSKRKPIGTTINLSTANTTLNESTMSVLSNLSENQSTLLDSQNQTPTLVAVNAVNPFHGATLANGVIQVPQHQQILIQIPTIDILKIQAQQQQQQQQGCEISTSCAGSLPGNGNLAGRSTMYQQRLFRHLKTESSVVEVSRMEIFSWITF